MEKARILRKAFNNLEPQEQDLGSQAYEKEPQAARQPSVLLIIQKAASSRRFFYALEGLASQKAPPFFLKSGRKNTDNIV